MIIVVPSCLKDADGARTRSDQNLKWRLGLLTYMMELRLNKYLEVQESKQICAMVNNLSSSQMTSLFPSLADPNTHTILGPSGGMFGEEIFKPFMQELVQCCDVSCICFCLFLVSGNTTYASDIGVECAQFEDNLFPKLQILINICI